MICRYLLEPCGISERAADRLCLVHPLHMVGASFSVGASRHPPAVRVNGAGSAGPSISEPQAVDSQLDRPILQLGELDHHEGSKRSERSNLVKGNSKSRQTFLLTRLQPAEHSNGSSYSASCAKLDAHRAVPLESKISKGHR